MLYPVLPLTHITDDVISYVREDYRGTLYDVEVQDCSLGKFLVVMYDSITGIVPILDIKLPASVYFDAENTIWYLSPAEVSYARGIRSDSGRIMQEASANQATV